MSDLQSAQPRPFKVTDPVPINIRANEKALENSKTGKVTAIVAVMHIFGETKSESPKNSAKKAKLGSNLKKLFLN